jgi:hypothetical protein
VVNAGKEEIINGKAMIHQDDPVLNNMMQKVQFFFFFFFCVYSSVSVFSCFKWQWWCTRPELVTIMEAHTMDDLLYPI